MKDARGSVNEYELDVNGGEGYSSYLTDIERFLDYFLKKEKKELY